MTESGPGRRVGYIELLRGNRNFRRLWLGRLISQTGDWFNSVALFTLLLNLTGSGEALGLVLIIKLLPQFFVGPLAGVVADRINRKTILLVADVLRGLLVFGFLFVHRAEQVWIVYTLAALEIILAAFFEPAESAAIPMIVERHELIAANALGGATWSVTLAFGAALGGAVTGLFGRNTAFVIDAISFFISAAFIWATQIPPLEKRKRGAAKRLSILEATGIADIIEGARYLKTNPHVIALLLIKTGWGLGGGVLLLLTIFGRDIFPLGGDGSVSIGLLYAARGTGALVGPAVARWIINDSPRTMRRTITLAFFVSALFYVLFSRAPSLMLALLFVIGAHSGGSIQWVFSTTLLQLAVPNRFLGRVFALEMGFLTLAMSLSTYATGWGLDHAGLSARQMAALMGAAFLIPGLVWLALQRWLDRSEQNQPHSMPPMPPPTPLADQELLP
jgi:predicted MFS family arabinose efflux permease